MRPARWIDLGVEDPVAFHATYAGLADAQDPHQPGEVAGYPAPIVDHAEERREALARYERIRS